MDKLKRYERTGIKEKKKKNKNLEESHQKQEIKCVTPEKSNRKEKYNIDLMSLNREYEKVKSLLQNSISLNDNIEDMIIGYQEYFDTYGNNMTAYGLRTFKKGIINSINSAKEALKKSSETIYMPDIIEEEEKVEDVLIDFCIENYESLENGKMDLDTIASLVIFLSERNIKMTNLGVIKEKVKSISKELRK